MALEEIVTGMSKAAEIIDGNFKKVVEKESTIAVKSTAFLNGTEGEINYKKNNGMLTVYGFVKPIPNSSGNVMQAKTFFNLPLDFKPDHAIYLNGVPSAGSTNYPQDHGAVITIDTSGNVTVQRASSGMLDYRFEVSYFA